MEPGKGEAGAQEKSFCIKQQMITIHLEIFPWRCQEGKIPTHLLKCEPPWQPSAEQSCLLVSSSEADEAHQKRGELKVRSRDLRFGAGAFRPEVWEGTSDTDTGTHYPAMIRSSEKSSAVGSGLCTFTCSADVWSSWKQVGTCKKCAFGELITHYGAGVQSVSVPSRNPPLMNPIDFGGRE